MSDFREGVEEWVCVEPSPEWRLPQTKQKVWPSE